MRCTEMKTLLSVLCLALGVTSAHFARAATRPTGVIFHQDTLFRSDNRGDNWCLTWAADGSQVTSMCDGNWLGGETQYHSHLYRILGGPDNFTREDLPGYPRFAWGTGSWFGYGIISVDGILYATISKTPRNRWSGPFRGLKLLKSSDNGQSWHRVNQQGQTRLIGPEDEARNDVNVEEMFFLAESGLGHLEQEAYPFSFVSFAQHGQDNSAAPDGYVYIYSPEGAHAHKLLLARVPKDKLGMRSGWEYYAGRDGRAEPIWTKDLNLRGCVHTFPRQSEKGHYFGWYSWLPSVVWNEGLGLYIMVNGGTYAGRGHDRVRQGLLRLLDAY